MVSRRLSALFDEQRNNQRKKKIEREHQLNDALVPLPSVRPRALTIPFSQEAQPPPQGKRQQRPQRTEEQGQSLFFTMLPPEIRTKIYMMVLGGHLLKILKDDRARYVKWIAQERSLLNLPKTCRRIYSECIDLLYSHNTFFFNDFDTILWFASTVLPQRLAVVRSLHVEWDCVCFWLPHLQPPPPFDKATWFEVWKVIWSMRGLRELTVRIWNGPKMDARTEIDVFQPLTEVRGLKRFELELPWRYQGDGDEGHENAPFRIRRVHRKWDPTPF